MSYKRFIAIMLMTAPLLACQQKAPPPQQASAAPPAAIPVHAALCTGERTFGELKRIVFEDASDAASGQGKAALSDLAAHTTLKVDAPVLDSYDEATMKAGCSGRLHLTVPAGAVPAAAGLQNLLSDARYTAQPAADGSGTVYRLVGGDDVIGALASVGSAGGSRVDQQAQAAASATELPARHDRPRRVIARAQPVVDRHSDDYVCEHGDPQSDLTIDACFRRDHVDGDGY